MTRPSTLSVATIPAVSLGPVTNISTRYDFISKILKKSKNVKCFQNHNFVSRIFLNAGLVALPTASAAVLSVPGSAIKATNAN